MRSYLLALLLLAGAATRAQRTEFFTIQVPPNTATVTGALYGRIDLLDARFDTACIGTVQVKAANHRALVKPQPALAGQLQSLLENLGGRGGEGHLLLQLRDFRFDELSADFREEGWCYFRANLYARRGDHYAFVTSIDSTIYIDKGDVTRPLLRGAGGLLTSFLSAALRQAPTDSVMSYAEVLAIDSIEKRHMPLYTSDHYQDGIYYTYASLVQQVPDINELMTRYDRKGRLKEVKVHMGEQDEVINNKFCYAIVDKGRIWLNTELGYHEMKKTGDHFEFDGRIFQSARTGNVVLGALSNGLMGALMGASRDVYECHMRVDHVTGSFLPMKIGQRLVFY